MIDELNEKFLIPGFVKFADGINGLPKAIIEHSSGSSMELYLYAAHVTAWRSQDRGDILFMSKAADFKQGKAIRGGIPIIFPQFGNGELPAHGFARNRDWKCVSSKILDSGSVSIKLALSDSAETYAIWPFKFELIIEFVLDQDLTINISLNNKSTESFSFQIALHTYFKVGDIARTLISGLKGVTYLDKLAGNKEITEVRDNININKACDSVYLAAPDRIEILDQSLSRKIIIEKSYLNDAVVWNPWIENSASIKDLHEKAYQEMLCVESAIVQPKADLQSGATYKASQKISCQAL